LFIKVSANGNYFTPVLSHLSTVLQVAPPHVGVVHRNGDERTRVSSSSAAAAAPTPSRGRATCHVADNVISAYTISHSFRGARDFRFSQTSSCAPSNRLYMSSFAPSVSVERIEWRFRPTEILVCTWRFRLRTMNIYSSCDDGIDGTVETADTGLLLM
jgi:hypothetical protein